MQTGLKFSSFAASVFALGLLSSCTGADTRWNPGQGFRTQILASAPSGNEFQIVELEGVQDAQTLQGAIADFYYAPGDDGERLKGQAPVARFVRGSGGLHIPADVLTLQMVTLYYHLQELRRFELQLLSESLITWPRKVGLRVRTMNVQTRFNNAFYSATTDAIYFVPYKGQELPIPLNPGVLAHELFHAYFASEVLRPFIRAGGSIATPQNVGSLDESALKQLLRLDYYLKSVNEGLADFWGLLYSNNPDFVGLSLPTVGRFRNLEKPTMDLSASLGSQKTIEEKVLKILHSDECGNPFVCTTGEGYQTGTVLARTLRLFMLAHKTQENLTDEEARSLMAKRLLQLLPKIKERLEKEDLAVENILLDWVSLFPSISPPACQTLRLSVTSSKVREALCSL